MQTQDEALLLKTVKCILYLGYILLHYVLIYNLEVSFNFHPTFLQVNMIKIKCPLYSKNCFLSYFQQFSSNSR